MSVLGPEHQSTMKIKDRLDNANMRHWQEVLKHQNVLSQIIYKEVTKPDPPPSTS